MGFVMRLVFMILNWFVFFLWSFFMFTTSKNFEDYLHPIDTLPFVIEMSSKGTPLQYVVMKGFSVPEPWGRWTEGHVAEMIFFTASRLNEPFDLVLFFDIIASPTHEQRVDFTYNGQSLLKVSFTSSHNHCLRLDLPQAATRHHLKLTISHPRVPMLFEPQSQDTRQLGVALKRMMLVPQNYPDPCSPVSAGLNEPPS